MTKYVVVDWAGNVMNWGEFESFDQAIQVRHRNILDKLIEEGHDVVIYEDSQGCDVDSGLYYQCLIKYRIKRLEEC